MDIPHFRKTPIAIAIALAIAENPLVHATPGDGFGIFAQRYRAEFESDLNSA